MCEADRAYTGFGDYIVSGWHNLAIYFGPDYAASHFALGPKQAGAHIARAVRDHCAYGVFYDVKKNALGHGDFDTISVAGVYGNYIEDYVGRAFFLAAVVVFWGIIFGGIAVALV